MKEMLKKLGIITMADLQLFKNTQVNKGEKLECAVARYYGEVFNENN